MPNFFAFKPHARRTIQLWNVTLICLLMLGFLAQVSVDYSRGWIVLFYFATLTALVVSRFAIVRITALARAAGLVSAQRICLIGTGAHIGAFVQHYEPWALGLAIVGCRFLTPVPATASAEVRRAALDRDLAEAAASVRSLEPDAIYLLLPWSATEIIDRCAKTFLALPVEIHLGPEQILHKFDEVELAKVGPLASLQLTRMPLSRAEVVQKRCLRSCLRVAGADRAHPAARRRRDPHQARQPGSDLLRAAPLRLQSAAVPHHQIPHHAGVGRRRRSCRRPRATIRA